MDSYPVAGQVLGWDLWFGITFNEALQVLLVPAAAIIVPRGLGITSQVATVFGICGLCVGVLLLYFTHDHQTPFQYAGSVIRFHLGSNKYHNLPHREDDLGKSQDIFISQLSESELARVTQPYDETLRPDFDIEDKRLSQDVITSTNQSPQQIDLSGHGQGDDNE